MGITTSPSARDNFILDFNNLRSKGLGNSEALATSCMKNIFNSDKPLLFRVLSRILNGSRIVNLTGCAGTVEIDRDFFRKCHDNESYEKIVENIYFTQMIMCASCEGKNGSKAPKSLEEIGDFQKKCIESQLDFFHSFDGQVDLLISFGRINQMIIDNYDTKNIIGAKCKHHVNINHPTTSGWNMVDLMHLSRGKYIERVEERVNGNNAPYRSSLINCYDQFVDIKNIVSHLLEE